MAMSGIGKKGVKAEINITPYIDILLVLLIIFMVATPLKTHDLPVRVPQPAPANMKIEVKPDTIVVDIEADHSILINTQPVTLQDLGAKLFRIYSARTNKNLYVRGDSELPYGEVFQILDIAKESGVGDIALIAREGNVAAKERAQGIQK